MKSYLICLIVGLGFAGVASAQSANPDPYGLNQMAQQQQQSIQQSREYYQQQAEQQQEREREMANQLLMQNMPQYAPTPPQYQPQPYDYTPPAQPPVQCYTDSLGTVICQ